ncbi:hypothetical protein HPB48_016562 [Haemaphysalis longicornis]|uniref:Chitin-binding type-2 domain-containing protein n=1 Tax=Haemaphysalis longicornis TaxID=44386 RepID=A0A9J6GS58_HAELO|nr:hypothetical protein HPB48_016562 [Haemaphysalis longicornis]
MQTASRSFESDLIDVYAHETAGRAEFSAPFVRAEPIGEERTPARDDGCLFLPRACFANALRQVEHRRLPRHLNALRGTAPELEPAADSGNNGTSTAAVPVGPVATTTTTADAAVANVSSADVGFSCEGRIFGYYGDPGNCSLFHYCEPFADPENNQFVLHAAYLCPNDTVFNQLSLTCAYAHEALPCRRAPEYYYINSHVVPADTQDSQVRHEALKFAADSP